MFLAKLLAAVATMLAAGPAVAQCLLCAPGEVGPKADKPAIPLRVEIGSGLDFNRVAMTAPGGGSVTIDPTSRTRSVSGAMAGLGGMFMAGTVTVRGEPGRSVRVDMPADVALRTPAGGSARIARLVTDLPPSPRLGADGTLSFSFGGRLDVSGDLDGDYGGRIAITVDYQ